MVSQLVAAINPDDLDALDDSLPLTKMTVDNLLGRIHTPLEYQFYFERNPHAIIYVDVYQYFLNDQRVARQIITVADKKQRELRGGYIDGKRPFGTPPSVSHLIAPVTAAAMNAMQGGHQNPPVVAPPQGFAPSAPMQPPFNPNFPPNAPPQQPFNPSMPPPAYGGPPPAYGGPPPAYGGPPPAYGAPPPPYKG